MKLEKLGLFVGGVLFGTAGISILSSREAKKAYTHCTAAVLRGKASVMKTAAVLKENCGDIYADAEELNLERAEAEKQEKIAYARAVLEEYEAE